MIKYTEPVLMYFEIPRAGRKCTKAMQILVIGETPCYFVTKMPYGERKFVKTKVFQTENEALISMHEARMTEYKKRLEIPERNRWNGAPYMSHYIWTDEELLYTIQYHRTQRDKLVKDKYK